MGKNVKIAPGTFNFVFEKSDTVHAIPITFAVKMVRLNVYIILSQSEDLALYSRSQLRLKLDN